MTHWKIKLSKEYSSTTPNFFSQITRTLEAADLECAMKQAKKDIETATKVFNWIWNLDSIEEVEAKP